MDRNSGVFWARIRARNADSNWFHSVGLYLTLSSVFSSNILVSGHLLRIAALQPAFKTTIGRQGPIGREVNQNASLNTTTRTQFVVPASQCPGPPSPRPPSPGPPSPRPPSPGPDSGGGDGGGVSALERTLSRRGAPLGIGSSSGNLSRTYLVQEFLSIAVAPG